MSKHKSVERRLEILERASQGFASDPGNACVPRLVHRDRAHGPGVAWTGQVAGRVLGRPHRVWESNRPAAATGRNQAERFRHVPPAGGSKQPMDPGRLQRLLREVHDVTRRRRAAIACGKRGFRSCSPKSFGWSR